MLRSPLQCVFFFLLSFRTKVEQIRPVRHPGPHVLFLTLYMARDSHAPSHTLTLVPFQAPKIVYSGGLGILQVGR